MRKDEMVFLASKLSQPERRQLAKLGKLLGGRMADTFSGSGSACWVQKRLLSEALKEKLFLLHIKPCHKVKVKVLYWSHMQCTVKCVLCIQPIDEEQWAATTQHLGTNSRF